MGTLVSNPAKSVAFQTQTFPAGLDRNRCADLLRRTSMMRAAAASTIRSGHLVTLNSSQELILSAGTEVIGVAAANKMTLGVSVVADQPVVLNGTTASNLTFANLVADQIIVRSAANQSGTLYVEGADYSANDTNGTVTRIALGSIGDGDTVYVTYAWSLTSDQAKFQGFHFNNSFDAVTWGDRRMPVILDPCTLYSTEYRLGTVAYTLTGVGSNLYCTNAGQITNITGSISATAGTTLVGKVIDLPSNGNPHLGFLFFGSRTAAV